MAKKKPKRIKHYTVEFENGRSLRASVAAVEALEKFERLTGREQLEMLVLVRLSATAAGKSLRLLTMGTRHRHWFYGALEEVGSTLRARIPRRGKANQERDAAILKLHCDGWTC